MAQLFSSRLLLRVLSVLVVTIVCAIAPISIMAQQGGTAQFTYDNNGRLKMVVLPNGETVTYDYDAAGNIISVRKTGPAVAIISFSPREGTAGDQVTFSGVGFGAGITDNTVSFNGVNARVISATSSQIVGEVPENATTGLVTITTPGGTVTTAEPFTIVARVRVSPATGTVSTGGSLQFTATVTSLQGDRSVTWSVNGINGGNSTVGTISATGLYTAPAVAPGSQPLIVRATSVAVPSLFGEARVTVRAPILFAALTAGVTVRRGLGINEPTPAISSFVSVRRGNGINELTPAFSPFVSVTTGPNITTISPNSLTRGAATTVTITGANLGGATALNFIDDNGFIDTTISAANLTANADGTALTATITVGSGAALGRRIVIVSSGTIASPAVNNGSNTITIVAP